MVSRPGRLRNANRTCFWQSRAAVSVLLCRFGTCRGALQRPGSAGPDRCVRVQWQVRILLMCCQLYCSVLLSMQACACDAMVPTSDITLHLCVFRRVETHPRDCKILNLVVCSCAPPFMLYIQHVLAGCAGWSRTLCLGGVVPSPQHMLLTVFWPPCSGISALSSLTLLALTGAIDLDPLRLADALSRLTGLSTLAISAWSLPGGNAGATWGVGLGVCSGGVFGGGTVSGNVERFKPQSLAAGEGDDTSSKGRTH